MLFERAMRYSVDERGMMRWSRRCVPLFPHSLSPRWRLTGCAMTPAETARYQRAQEADRAALGQKLAGLAPGRDKGLPGQFPDQSGVAVGLWLGAGLPRQRPPGLRQRNRRRLRSRRARRHSGDQIEFRPSCAAAISGGRSCPVEQFSRRQLLAGIVHRLSPDGNYSTNRLRSVLRAMLASWLST